MTHHCKRPVKGLFCRLTHTELWTKFYSTCVLISGDVCVSSPQDKQVRGVILLDKDFTFKYGLKQTGVRHGLMIESQARFVETVVLFSVFSKINRFLCSHQARGMGQLSCLVGTTIREHVLRHL